jgi:hypothetical protein
MAYQQIIRVALSFAFAYGLLGFILLTIFLYKRLSAGNPSGR